MSKIDYYRASSNLQREELKTDDSSSQIYSIFYEKYEGGICFKVIYKRKGTDGENELHDVEKISKEFFDSL